MKIEFTRHVFATLTYTRDYPSEQRWGTVSKDFNRYIQRLKRNHAKVSIEYLRVVESHADGYPHIHTIIQFPDARIRIENTRYFTKDLFKKWKSLWGYGHSDYQKPRVSGLGTISYVMKYLIKNTTSKTIWSKVYAVQNGALKTQRSLANLQKIPMDGYVKNTTLEKNANPTRQHGVKLCTWSRNFDFTPFSAPKKK